MSTKPSLIIVYDVAAPALKLASTLANEVITTYGVVKDKTPKGNGFRFKVEFWASNEEGQTKTIGWTEVDIGV